MAVKRNGLGKGLDSLIPNKTVKTTEKQANKTQKEKVKVEKSGETIVKITQVEPNSEQPRKDFDEDALLELADSIKQFGVLQPLLVQKKNDYYEIIAGERRWRAAKLAGLTEIPVIVKEFHLKQDEIAERVSKSRTAVTNSMRLLKLNSKVQQMVIDDMISTGHARALLALEDEEQQYTIANKIFDEKLSVRETEKLIKILKNPKKTAKKEKIEHTFIYENLEEKMKGIMGTKVNVNPKSNGKGKIEIEYYSEEELERIFDLIMSIQS